MTKLSSEFDLPQISESGRVAAFVDTSVAGWQSIVASLPEGIEVVVIDGARDGLTQMAEWAATHQGYGALHILSHGGAGRVSLGSTHLTSDLLAQSGASAALAALGRALRPDGDLLLYGCDVAAGEQGQAFIEALSRATGADVAASQDATGAAILGGNWALESWHGHIETAVLQAVSYTGLLSTISFDSSQVDMQFDQTSVTRVETVSGQIITFSGGALPGNGLGAVPEGDGDYLYSYTGVDNDYKLTISADAGYTFDLTSAKFVSPLLSASIVLTYSNGSTTPFSQALSGGSTTVNSFSTSIDDVTKVVISGADYLVFNDFAISDVKPIPPAPTVSASNISYTSTGSGTGGTYKIGDTVTVSWDNSGTGDNNSSVTGVSIDFSQFGGGAVSASESSGVWSASYTILSGAIDLTGRKASVTASNAGSSSAAVPTSAGLTVDNVAPVVTDGRISISGASGTGGAYKIGDTVTATWNNTAGGDNNSDAISSATVDFSAFGGGAAVSATNSSGTWTATYTIVSGGIDSGNRNVSVTATDNAGNATTRADSSNAMVDNVAPTVSDGNIAISGGSGAGGAYKIGDTVAVSWNNTAAGDNNADTVSSATVDFSAFGGGAAVAATNSAGTWSASYTIVSGAINGATNRNVSLTVADNAGNTTSTSDTSNATVDNVAPTITLGSVAFSVDSGSSASDFVTATAAQTISATLSGALGAGDILYASLDNGSTWTDVTATVAGTVMSWSTTLSSSGTLKLKVSDAAGNDGPSTSQAFVLDTSAPSAPAAPDMTSGTDSGISTSDDITNDDTPTFSGTAESGSSVTLYDSDGTTILGTATAAGGNWSITASTLAAGNHTLTARATDVAGNVSGASSGLAITVDTSAPTGLAMSSTSVATANAGSAATVATLSASDSQAITYALAVGNGTNDADNGSFSISGNSLKVGSFALSAGSYKVYLSATDAAGNAAAQAFTINVDDAPSVSSIVRAGGVSSTVLASATSINYTVTFSEGVTGVDASDFSLTGSGSASGSIAAVSGSGSTYTVTVDSLAGDGTLRLDLNGSGTGIANGGSTPIAGGYGAGQIFTLDHTAPAMTFGGIAFSADSGTSATDLVTQTAAQTISATLSAALEAGDVVYGSLDGGSTWTDVTSSVSGTSLAWATTLAASDTLQLKVVDAAGNEGAATSQAYVLDTSAPAAPSTPDMESGSDSGSSSSDNVTNDTTPGFSGTAESGSIVKLYDSDGTTVLGTATAAGGVWSITPSALGEGSHTVTAKATDVAGNVSAASSGLTVTVDTTAPSIAFSGIAFSADSGTSASDFVTATAAQTITATLGAALTAGDVVWGSLDGGASWTDVTASVSGTALAWSATLTASNTLQLKVTDAAGNDGAIGSQAYVLDTSGPGAPSAPDLAAGSDSGSSSTDDVTNDTTPTFAGTAESGSTVTLYDTDGSTALGSAVATGGNWSITSSALAAGSHTITVKATDAAGNVSSASSGTTILVDAGAPAVASVVRTGAASTNDASVSYTVTFNESVTGVDVSDFALTASGTAGGAVSSVSGSGSSYTVNVTGVNGDGTLRLDLNGSGTGIVDTASNAISTGFTAGEAYTLDHVAPTLTITSSTTSLQEGESATVTFTFSEDPGSSFAAGDVAVTGGTLGALSGTGTVRTASFTATTAGNAALSVAAASYTDAAGNAGGGATSAALTVTAAPQTGNLVDGVPVTSNTALDPQTGLSETTTVVAPIAPTRVDDPNTPNATLADIPLGIGSGPVATGLTVGLAVGTGLQAEGPAALLTNSQALLDLIQRIEDRTVNGSPSQVDMTGDGQDFLGALGSGVRLQTGTLALQGGGAGVQLAVNGSAPGAAPAQGTAIGLVLDSSALQAGTTVQLNNVDFAAVVGSAILRGGAGANYVVGDNASQNIFLGAEDDILNGGGGNDFIGSRGGNDVLDGGDGNDLVAGGEADDQVKGGSGDDVLVGGRSTTGDWTLYIDGTGPLTASHSQAVLASGPQETVTGPELDNLAFELGFLRAASTRVVDVALLYSALGRLPDLGGLSFWSTAPVSVVTVAEHLLKSDERLASQGLQDDKAFLQSVYQQVLGRAADTAGLGFWGQALGSGVSRANVLSDFALGAEHRTQATTANGIAVAQANGMGEAGWLASSGNDRLEGGAGNDELIGGDGSDVLVGGEGRDTAQFSARMEDYRMLLGADGQLRVQTMAASDVDTLSGIEVAAFGDKSLELDFMAAPAASLKEVGMLYASLLGRAADVAGLRWWLSTGLEGKALASAFAASAEGVAFSAGKSDAQFVQMLYLNAGLSGSAVGGSASWTAYLGSHSRGEMLAAWVGNQDVQAAEFAGDGLWLI